MAYVVKEIYYTLQGEGANAGRAAVFLRFAGCNLWSGLEKDRAKAVCQFCDTDFVGTDGPSGGRFETAAALAEAVARVWPGAGGGGANGGECGGGGGGKVCGLKDGEVGGQRAAGRPLVVCTGGEPLLQLDAAAVAALHGVGFEVAVETNGTVPLPGGSEFERPVGEGSCSGGRRGEIGGTGGGKNEPVPVFDWVCVSPKAGAELVVVEGDELKLVFPQVGAEPERFAGMGFRHFYLQPMDGPEREENTRLAVAYCLAHPQWRLSMQTHKYLGIA